MTDAAAAVNDLLQGANRVTKFKQDDAIVTALATRMFHDRRFAYEALTGQCVWPPPDCDTLDPWEAYDNPSLKHIDYDKMAGDAANALYDLEQAGEDTPDRRRKLLAAEIAFGWMEDEYMDGWRQADDAYENRSGAPAGYYANSAGRRL